MFTRLEEDFQLIEFIIALIFGGEFSPLNDRLACCGFHGLRAVLPDFDCSIPNA